MIVTDEIRTHALAWYGPRADDYLAAIERIVTPCRTNGMSAEVLGEIDVWAIEGADVLGVRGSHGLRLPEVRRSSMDLAAMADVVEFDWLAGEAGQGEQSTTETDDVESLEARSSRLDAIEDEYATAGSTAQFATAVDRIMREASGSDEPASWLASTTETATHLHCQPGVAFQSLGDALREAAAPAAPEGPEPTLSLAMEVRLGEELSGDLPAGDATPEGPDA